MRPARGTYRWQDVRADPASCCGPVDAMLRERETGWRLVTGKRCTLFWAGVRYSPERRTCRVEAGAPDRSWPLEVYFGQTGRHPGCPSCRTSAARQDDARSINEQGRSCLRGVTHSMSLATQRVKNCTRPSNKFPFRVTNRYASAGHRRSFGTERNSAHRHHSFRAINSTGAMRPLDMFWVIFSILSGAFLPIRT